MYEFLNGQSYQTCMDKEGFEAYMSYLNFAMHCASTACGIPSEHLLAEDAMVKSIYCFHAVFQTRKILNILGLGLPYIDEFNLESYRKLCNGFDVDRSTNRRYKYDEKRFIQDGKTGHHGVDARSYFWIISQLLARFSIIGKDERALDAQSIWLSSFEELVKSEYGIGNEIHRYQDVLQYG